MHKVKCPEKMKDFEYKINTSGIADVWIRKNQKELDDTEEEGRTGYSADEVYFHVTPELIGEVEIAADMDFFFNQMEDAEDGASADHLGIENYRLLKRKEISDTCENTIYAGIDVEIDGEVQHFSLGEKDQINLFGKQAQLAAGATQLEYHQDGSLCVFYSAEDMSKIIETAMQFVSYHTTYCNSMFSWIEACEKASDMSEIAYGVQIPVEHQSEVLKGYLSQMEG